MSNEIAGQRPDKNKTITIVVNGREHRVEKGVMTFEEIVALAYPNDTGNQIVYTVTYRRGHSDNHEGTLAPGQSVRIKDGMIFNVTRTDKS
jgi:hypothetical protein